MGALEPIGVSMAKYARRARARVSLTPSLCVSACEWGTVAKSEEVAAAYTERGRSSRLATADVL